MKLSKEILIKMLENEEALVAFPNLCLNTEEFMEMECYNALTKIKAIIENDSLSDFECVERIVCLFEEMGSDGGGRHDFG